MYKMYVCLDLIKIQIVIFVNVMCTLNMSPGVLEKKFFTYIVRPVMPHSAYMLDRIIGEIGSAACRHTYAFGCMQ